MLGKTKHGAEPLRKICGRIGSGVGESDEGEFALKMCVPL